MLVIAPTQDPIAIIGIGCRFPGASGVDAFWQVLRDGLETTGNYPGGRLPFIDDVYRTGAGIASQRGGFLPDLDRFDAEFFGVSPREAALLDPQQRLLLEVAWEAIEDAGIPTAKIAGSQTGVFVGLWTTDYEGYLYEQPGQPDFYATTGGGRYPASGRLAYFFDLRGPNLTLDTACSSSLVAIHLACHSLRLAESEMALAGGANVILRPEITLAYSAANMLSPDGRSKFGDAAADGYVRSEGAGLVLLKPLSRAVADRDPIYAVIRGSAVNNDGRSSGLLVSPSREGQGELLRSAFRNANVDAGAIDYIEAHGTGTLAGDPVEIETIGRAVDVPGRKRPCLIGSVKTNIGHTESAAGIAGVIKVALSLQRGAIPASLHQQVPNPAIAWNTLPVVVQRATAPWPHTEPVRLAGVSGFGITGTNAHLVLENFEAVPADTVASARDHLFILSAHSEKALEAMAASWRERMQSNPAWPESLAALAYTAGLRRSRHDFLLAITAGSREELNDKLSAWLSRQDAEGVRAGRRPNLERTKAVFVFPGQGGQWAGMAQGLMGESVFRDALITCDKAILQHAGWSVIDRLMLIGAETSEDVSVVQPCLFAVMVALSALWRSWGIEPQAVVGHSMGESAAAAVSGALSIEDAAAVICYRSHLMRRASGRGRMFFAELSLEDATALAREYGGRISVAANNSPRFSVLSGDAAAIEDALRQLTEREVFCRRIKVDVASHCSQMDPLQGELRELLRGIQPRAGSIPLYSTTSGHIEGSALDAEYWGRNLRQPVLFSSAVQSLLRDGFDTFVEIGPHPVLLHSIEEGIRHSGTDAIAVASLRRERNERAEMLNSVASLYVSGFPVDFRRLYPEGSCLRLPIYPWQRERHWIQTDAALRRSRGIASPPAFASDCANNVYELQWFEVEVPAPTTLAGLWILLSCGRDAADQLNAQFQAGGNECICVSDTNQLERALEVAGDRCRGVIRFPRVLGADPGDASAEGLDIVQTVRAVAAAVNPPRLWLVSTGVWRLPDDTGEVCAAHGPAWGLGRVIEREYPELRCVNVDLSTSPDKIEIETLVRLVRQHGSDEQLAVRGGKYFVARYESLAVEDSDRLVFRADAAYLITGGLGGIGLLVADWLVQRGARHIVLVGRRPPDDAASAQMAALKSLGAVIRVFTADAADDTQVKSLLDAIAVELPPLKGVFHLAAVTDSVLLNDLEAESLGRVMRSKAVAAWALHRHLDEENLDFFVLFSSVAAAISQPGLGSYAAANAYVEALARFRRARGLKAQSIQWGSWLSTGLSTDEKVRNGVRIYQERGIQPLATDDALRILGWLIASQRTDVLALDVRWDQLAHSFEGAAPPGVFARLLPKAEAAQPPPAVESISEKLLRIEPGRRRKTLEAHLREKLATVLKTDPERIDPAKPFAAMGVDSLMALEFVRRLGVTTSLRLPATIVFNYPTIHTLTREIARRIGIPMDRPEPTLPVHAIPEMLATSSVADITDEQAIEALVGRSGQT